MDLWEICRARKEQLGITNEEIAAEANLPIGTVKKFFSGASKSPYIFTVAPIFRVMGISLDEVFGISVRLTPTEEMLSARQEQLEHRVESKDKTIDMLWSGIRMRNHIIAHMIVVILILLGWCLYLDANCLDIGLLRK